MSENATTTREEREALKKQIFAKKNDERLLKEITLNGVKLELRQPRLRDIMRFQQMAESDRDEATGQILAQYTYWPGTGDLVFTSDEDIQQLLDMPFDEEMMAVSEALNSLAGIVTKDEESPAAEVFGKTPGSETSSPSPQS